MMNTSARRMGKKCLQLLISGVIGFVLLSSAFSLRGQEARKLVKKVDPVYPELAQKMNITGTVKVEAVVAPDGSVKQVNILGGHPVLVSAVENAVKQWKYSSASAETKKMIEFKF